VNGSASAPLNAVQIIRTKRDGGELTPEQIRWFLDGYTAGEVADEQAAALLMAIVFRSLSRPELDAWTDAMIASGERLDLSMVPRPTVDKHSTGGVGDKVSLVLCPLVAACGAAVPQLSGRGLGHTGGTLDKMEAIPGWRATLTPSEMLLQLQRVGAAICAAGPGLAPTDAKLYALRDVTGTVESIPLIASSIMAKKIAEGTSALVLDVKVGSGAFMTDVGAARQLAETMVEIGRDHGVRTTAFLTDMNVPLGRAVGNALEVEEAIETLNGRGPGDLVDLTLALAREMLELVGVSGDRPANALATGTAKEVWSAMIHAQGCDATSILPVAHQRHVIPAAANGYLTRLDALRVGECAWRLGAGRARKEHPVSAIAGVICHAKPGDHVVEGQPLLELHLDDARRLPDALEALQGAIDIGSEPPPHRPLVIDVIRA
jgi:thymidine phosphorylase